MPIDRLWPVYLGPQGLVELVTLMGFYAMLAFNANAVELDVPANCAEPTLPVSPGF